MQIILVPSSVGNAQPDQDQFLTSCVINDTLAIDAGPIGFYLDPRAQARVRHVFLTHTHIDHIASLPSFVENAYDGRPDCVTLYGSEVVRDCLRSDVFNGRVWPDFFAMSGESTPFLKWQTLEAHRPVEVEGLRILPVPVDHLVPTFGYLVEERGKTVVFTSDTGPTRAIWDAANGAADVRAVFLEATFPDEMAWLAEASKHLTPALFAIEVAKLKRPCPVIAVHMKARFRRQVEREILALGLGHVSIARFGTPYDF